MKDFIESVQHLFVVLNQFSIIWNDLGQLSDLARLNTVVERLSHYEYEKLRTLDR